MPPKRRRRRAPGAGAGLGADVSSAACPDHGALARRLVACLAARGYCVADFGLGAELLADAAAEAGRLEARAPAAEVADGLLGEEGSARIRELECDAPEYAECPGLQLADSHLTTVTELLRPYCEDLGFALRQRSRGILHVAGYPPDDPPPLAEADCERWLQEFGRHRLMLVVVLGPAGGSLELCPFGDEGANPVELQLRPGATVVLRADALTHRYASLSSSACLTCWLTHEVGGRGRGHEAVVLSPQYLELDDWKQRRLQELKRRQVVGPEGQEWDLAVPREWQHAANRLFPTGPQVGLRSLACKFPQTWEAEGFWRALGNGMDFARQVPLLRWNHADMYDPAPTSWKWSKTSCQHGCFVEGLEFFDCRFFGISPFEAKGMDPNQRHILETSYEALSGAGFSKKALMRSLIGVYIAAAVSEFAFVPQGPESAGATSGANSITSNRISFCLGLQGPSYTLDNQGAGSLSCVTAASLSLRMQTSRYRPNHTCLVGGTYIQLAGSPYVLASSQGWLSRQGRCFTFDYCADGHIKSDGIANAVLRPVAEQVDGQDVVDEGMLGTVAACSMSHTGRGASLTAPSGPQERELVLEAVRQASISVADVDAVECWGESGVLPDAVEAEALRCALRGDLELADVPLSVTSGKTQFGSMCEAAGMGALLRVVLGQRLGYMAPGLHLTELNPHIEVWTGEEPMLFASEVLPYRSAGSYHGASARSIGGTLAHVLTFASAPSQDDMPTAAPLQPIAFWPAGGGELPESAAPSTARPYHVLGSWSEWSRAEAMEDEGGGVYAVEIALGANRLEQFQLLLDGDPERVLHPDRPAAPSGAAVLGPSPPGACRYLRWAVDGRGPEAPLPPGARVRVRLRVAGRWRAVEWERVAELAPGPVAEGRYYVVGGFNDWSFRHELRPVGESPFLFEAEVGPLPWAGGDFQIVHNQDWSQTFHPATPGEPGDQPEVVLGPGESPEQLCWSLCGLRGDVFRIQFRRVVDASGVDERRVSWRRVGRRR